MSEQIVVKARADVEAPALSESHARDLVEQIRLSTGRLLEAIADIEMLVSSAYHGRAWIALGYESWEELVAEELKDARLWRSIDERDQRMRALSEAGLTLRPIAAVMGVSKNTVHRAIASSAGDLATVPNGTVAKAADRSDAAGAPAGSVRASDGDGQSTPQRSRGLDGKERPSRRVAPLERVDRIIEATRLHEQGWSQQQIADEISKRTGETVSQRTISEDLKVSRQWSDSLDEPDRERFASGDLESAELTAKAQIEIVAPKGPDLSELSAHGMRDLVAALDFLRDEVVERDEWLDQQHAASERLGSAAVFAMMRPATWLATDVDYTGFTSTVLENTLVTLAEIQKCLDKAQSLAESAREAGTEVVG